MTNSADPKKKDSHADNQPAEDLKQLQHEELSGNDDEDLTALERSETDEDEDEGVGDGNISGTRIGNDAQENI